MKSLPTYVGRDYNGYVVVRFRVVPTQYSLSYLIRLCYFLLESGALGFVYALVRPLAKQSGI